MTDTERVRRAPGEPDIDAIVVELAALQHGIVERSPLTNVSVPGHARPTAI